MNKQKQLEKIIEKKNQTNKQIIYRCDHHKQTRDQRRNELIDGLGLEGTMGYQEMGCYQCYGVNQKCRAYQDIMRIKLVDSI